MSNKLSLLVNFIGHDKITGLMKTIVGLGRDGSKSIKALAGEAKKLENELASVQKGLAKGAGNVSDLVNRERDLESQLARVNAQLTRQKGLAAINADRMAMRRTADDAKQRGQDKMLSGTAMATPFILANKAAMDFSSGMVDIQQKAELSNAETDRMAINILALAKAAHQLPEDMRMDLALHPRGARCAKRGGGAISRRQDRRAQDRLHRRRQPPAAETHLRQQKQRPARRQVQRGQARAGKEQV